MNVNVSGKNECVFQIQHNDNSVEIQVDFGENSLNVENLEKNLCQNCLEKTIEVFPESRKGSEKEETKDICLVDFQTGKLYSLDKRYLSYYLNDFYVFLQHSDEYVRIVVTEVSEGQCFI